MPNVIERMGNSLSIPSGLPDSLSPINGQTTIAVTNTAVQLPSNTLQQGVIVQALASNAGNVIVGGAGVTASTGFQLQAGQATSAAVNNTNALWVVGAGVGDGVCFIGS